VGEALALLAAITWAVAVILFRKTPVDAQGINLFKNVLACGLLGATLAVFGLPLELARSNEDWWRILASGILGLAVADTLIFIALQKLGAVLMATVDIAYTPIVVIMSIILLNEPMTASLIAGGSLVVGGVLWSITGRTQGSSSLDPRELRIGVAAGLAGIILMAIGVVLIKPVLEKSGLVEITFLRLAVAAGAQLLWTLASKRGRAVLSVFRPSPAWKVLVPASILGTYVAMLLWLGGFKWADASIAAILNQTSTIWIVLLGRIVLKEQVSPRRAVGTGIAIVGAVVVLIT
jgi:drug/metabolite transporter (DMT)-like permease